jgi:carboxyl-terminal processing protease
MKQKLLWPAVIVLITAASLVGGYYERRSRATLTTSEASSPNSESLGFDEAVATSLENFAGDIDLEKLTKHSILGMLHQLDPHSSFFTKEEFDRLQTETNSRIYGIGVSIVKRYDRVYVISATPGAPGHRAGLRYGDAILKVDGDNVENWPSEQVVQRVRGEKGDELEMTVERVGVAEPITVRIKRDEVKLPTVRNAFMLEEDGIGYIALTGGFSLKTSEELTEAITDLRSAGMKKLILDLRGNPGGLLNQAVEVARKFLQPNQRIVEVRGRDTSYTPTVYEVPENNVPENVPLVVLINGQSASASEVVAGALQDHDRAIIVGENSFGKGLVQNVKRVWGGAGITLTVAKYYTPTGRSIQRDYSNVSFYDYYFKRNGDGEKLDETPRGDAVHTDIGRTVYGGGGITPDIEAKAPEADLTRSKLFYGVFSFARQLVGGQIPGHREYRITESQTRKSLIPDMLNRYPVTDELIASSRQYLATKKEFNVSEEKFTSHLNYIRALLKRELLTAAYSPEIGEQVYVSEDTQLQRAIKSFAEAQNLIETARRAQNIQQ